MDLASLQAWVGHHGPEIGLVAVYLLLTVLPRPHAADFPKGSKQAFVWGIIDRLAFLTAKGLPGNLKWIGLLSPPPDAQRSEDAGKPKDTAAPSVDAPSTATDDKTDDEKPTRAA